MLGPHQGENALLAAKAAQLLVPAITEASIKEGLEAARWPGRMERIAIDPPVLLDGAHNEGAAEALAAGLDAHPEHFDRPLHFVFGLSTDKQAAPIAARLARHAASWTLTAAKSSRARPAAELARALAGAVDERRAPVSVVPDSWEALDEARRLAQMDGGCVVVCGSLYLVGELRRSLVEPMGTSSRSSA